MLTKKTLISIGVLILAISVVGFLSLRSKIPTEPVKIYKATTPTVKSEAKTEIVSNETARIGQPRNDIISDTEPHTLVLKETKPEQHNRQELLRNRQELLRNRQELLNERENLTHQLERLETEKTALQKEYDTASEERAVAALLRNKAETILVEYADVIGMTSEKFITLSAVEQKRFLQRAVAYDLSIQEFSDFLLLSPQSILGRFEKQHPGLIQRLQNLPSAARTYGGLQ